LRSERNNPADERYSDASVSPEYELLLACARSRMDEPHAAIIRELARRALDWDGVVALGRRHSLFPLLYRHLAALAADAVPPAQLARLRELHQGNAARNLFLLEELGSVVRSLEEDGIGAMPWKGPLLAIAGYGDLSLRRFVDLDILVRRDDVERAIGTLTRLGYRMEPVATPAQRAFLIRTQHDLAFRRDEGRLIVELHWEVAPRLFAAEMTATDLWRDAAPRAIAGREFLVMTPEAMLLSLCVHGSKHLWERLAWICDVAEWLRAHPSLDWKALLARVQRTGQERMLFVGLQLAVGLLNAPVPAHVAAAIDADRAVPRLAGQAEKVIFSDPPRPPGMITSLRFHLLTRRNRGLKLRYLLHLLTPSAADISLFRAPRPLQFAYYLVRPLRLLTKREHLH
jgi:hypothetical protein